MKAADVRCPRCGEPFADIPPQTDLRPAPDAFLSDTIGCCRKGDMILVTAIRLGDAVRFEVLNLAGSR